mgnify:CR=1 FL=1
MPEITVKTEIRNTEDEGKVRTAIENVINFERLDISQEGDKRYYIAKAYTLKALDKLANLIRRQRIELTARSIFEKSLKNNNISFKLNKQAAFANKVSFVTVEGEATLGAIEVDILAEDPRKIIDYIAPIPKSLRKAKQESERNLELQ